MTEKRRFDVSIRMTVFFGPGELPAQALAIHPVRLAFACGSDGAPALAAIGDSLPHGCDADIIFLVDPEGCREVLGHAPEEHGVWYLTTEQRALALALRDCALPEPAAQTLRTVRAVELLWSVTEAVRTEALIAADGAGLLCELDARRIAKARALIDQSAHEKLTLDAIARACGLNRVKLSQGFRAIFGCSVGEAIAERRLTSAHELLRVTDLPVSSVGYRCGYNNNASFSRAFSRRYGLAPTQLRARRAAA